MAILTPYLLCALFLAALYALMRLALFSSNLAARRAVSKSGIYTPKTVRTVLISTFGMGSLLTKKYLPHEPTPLLCDEILVLAGGIAVISIEKDGTYPSPEAKKEALHRIFREAGYKKRLPITHITLALPRKKGEKGSGVPMSEMMRTLLAMKKKPILDKKQRKALLRLIESAAVSPRNVRKRPAPKRQK